MPDEIRVATFEPEPPAAVEPLAPGASDPASPAVSVAAPAVPPLGPGDDDPRSPVRGVAGPATEPATPGDGAPADFEIVASQALGPGSPNVSPRNPVRIPIRPMSAESL